MNRNKIIKFLGVVLLVVVTVIYFKFFTSNTNFKAEEVYVEVPTGSNYQDVERILSPLVKNMGSFEFIAKRRSYPENVKAGRFLLKKGMSAFQLVAAMRRNVPVQLAFNNQERLEDLCERLSSQIEPDTTKLLATFYDPEFLKTNGFTKQNVFAMFLPNTSPTSHDAANLYSEKYNRFQS